LLLKQLLGIPGEFENLHAFVHVGDFGALMSVDFALAAFLLLAPPVSTFSLASPRIIASVSITASCSATRKRYSLLVTTIGRPNKLLSDTLRTVSWNVEKRASSGRNYFGRLSRDAGQSRMPEPPHVICGVIGLLDQRYAGQLL
jgi:hypothetical protein